MDDDNLEEEEYTHVYGIQVPEMDTNIQPLECLILIKGINMDDGSPTMTSIGSDGITPWEAVGMMSMEIERLNFMTMYASMRDQAEEHEQGDE